MLLACSEAMAYVQYNESKALTYMYRLLECSQQVYCLSPFSNLVERWRKAKDNKLTVSILATDMSKAFDSLHPPLIAAEQAKSIWFSGQCSTTSKYLSV